MEDPILNKSLEETRELQTRWNQFREFIRVAIERGKATPEAEMKFLELKSFIAMLHDGFMSKLDHDQKTGQNIMSIVGDCIMLRRISRFNDAEKQKFEFDWNECYLLIGEQVGALESEKNRLAGINERSYKTSKRIEAMKAKVFNFFHSAGLKYTVILLGLVFVLWIVPAYIYSYRNLASIPGVNKVYFFVADYVYRPYLNKDYAYDSWDDVHATDAPKDDVHGAIQKDETTHATMTADNFKGSVMNEIGISRASGDEARKLFDTNTHFETQAFKALGKPVRFYYILFKDSDDARHFIDIINKDLKDPALPKAVRDNVTDNVFIKRLANLVAIGISNHQMRYEQIFEKFGVDKEKNSSADVKL